MARSARTAKARCRWCGGEKRRRYPERAECDGCANPSQRRGRARRERRARPGGGGEGG